ncbi:Pre-mRNA-processing protein prp40 [Psilocybe cubensis]|uniref:Pre-mRNA-processing protein prp40 n=2 Tax=Psilocybe cubensis TaxID=181762 RepID=A0A8H7XW15_PSICU|nr:Pre-mRNA-processing protein prp40 [Psilocybe cubensis]KAH9479534.1 Pre-mRNA-processing protein prp40 [Psilocybe cubensis]
MNVWTEHRNPEGRTYWFNTGTRQSVWEKPDDLKTPFERALSSTKWKEYFSGGRKYYYNTETKESKWDMPDELLLVLEKVEKEPQTAAVAKPLAVAAPGFTPVTGAAQGGLVPMGGADPSSSTPASQSSQTNGSLTVGAHTGALPLAPSSVLPVRPNLPDDPVIPHNGFLTVEEGEKAFIHLLRKAGVDANWTWDQTMRAIITDPLYKALNTLAEKKACWEKYTNGLKVKEQEEREARLSKLRPAIRNMLKGNPNVFHYTTFPTADKLFSQHPIWQQAKIESERRLIFEEYVNELREREVSETRAARARSISKVVALFKDLNVDVVTKWRDAHELLVRSEEWHSDAELRKLPTLDILLAFEDYSRVREREYEEQTRRAQVEKTRRERKAREAFKSLLHELIESGALKARTKWKEVYPLFRDDNRYLDMLGNPGSNPLELFWDAVDVLDQQLDTKVVIVEEAIRRHNAKLAEGTERGNDNMDVDDKPFVVTPETTWGQFSLIINGEADASLNALSDEELRLVYKTLHDVALKKQADEKRRYERRQRHLQDDLRYAMKKLPEPLDISLKYEDIVPLIENLPEYKALEDEEGRRAAFAKYVKRQKERMRETGSDDGGSTTSRKRKEPLRDRDDDHRDKDRDREREKERERERGGDRDKRDRDSHRDREKERDRAKDYDRSRSSRHHHRYDDYDDRRSRDYGRGDREKESERDKERDGYKISKYHRDGDDRKKDKDSKESRSRAERGSSVGRDWDQTPKRERSDSVYKDDSQKRDLPEDKNDRADKRPRLDRGEEVEIEKRQDSVRAETPEEGEI